MTPVEYPTLDPVPDGALVLMVGPPAAGKTTLLRDVPQHQVVSLDRLRATASHPGDQAATADAADLQHRIVTMRLRRGETTYLDSCWARPDERKAMLWLARQYHRPTIAVVVDAPLPLLLERNARRPRHQRVPVGFVRRYHLLTRNARHQLAVEQVDEIRHHPTGSTGH